MAYLFLYVGQRAILARPPHNAVGGAVFTLPRRVVPYSLVLFSSRHA